MRKLPHLRTDEVPASSCVQGVEILYENFSPLVYVAVLYIPIEDQTYKKTLYFLVGVPATALFGIGFYSQKNSIRKGYSLPLLWFTQLNETATVFTCATTFITHRIVMREFVVIS